MVMNLLSSKQVMNTSFDPLRIVNTYGAFGRYGGRGPGAGGRGRRPPFLSLFPRLFLFEKHHEGTHRGDFPGDSEPGSQGPRGGLGGVPVPVQTWRRSPAPVPHIAVSLPPGLAHVVRCLPGELQKQNQCPTGVLERPGSTTRGWEPPKVVWTNLATVAKEPTDKTL